MYDIGTAAAQDDLAWRRQEYRAAAVEFRVLGPLTVLRNGSPIDVGSRLPRCVLAVLLAHQRCIVPLHRLVEDLWGQRPPATATAALQIYISQLRKSLEPERPPRGASRLLVTQAPGYVLQVDPAAVDASVFESLMTEGRQLLAAGRPSAAADALRRGLALWRGDPYADLAYEECIQPEVTRLREMHAAGIDMLMEAELAATADGTLIADFHRYVSAEPLRERRWALLALALYRCGRQADAVRALAQAREQLIEELGIEPGPALRKLQHDILRQSPTLTWNPLPGAALRHANLHRQRGKTGVHLGARAAGCAGRSATSTGGAS